MNKFNRLGNLGRAIQNIIIMIMVSVSTLAVSGLLATDALATNNVINDDPTTVITRSGTGTTENPPVTTGARNPRCIPGNRAVVGVGINGGAAGNQVTASAFCFPARVAGPATAVKPVGAGSAANIQEGTQVDGRPSCPVLYQGVLPDSRWRVICTFF